MDQGRIHGVFAERNNAATHRVELIRDEDANPDETDVVQHSYRPVIRKILAPSQVILRSPPHDVAGRLTKAPEGDQHMTRMNLSLSVVVLTSGALLLAGCGGGSSSPGVAHLSNTSGGSTANTGGKPSSPESSASTQQKMVKFSQCMRTHGEPEFPEPTEGGIRIQNHNGHGPNPESPRFQAAEKACSKYAPSKIAPSPAEQAKMQEGALKFSACMRSHGVPNFPDPEFHHSGGGVGIRIGGKGSGIDPNSPQFRAAQKTCQSDLPGPKGGPGNVALAP